MPDIPKIPFDIDTLKSFCLGIVRINQSNIQLSGGILYGSYTALDNMTRGQPIQNIITPKMSGCSM